MKTNSVINFDMDGTIALTYSVDGWVEKLRQFDTSPYREAPAIPNLNQIARQLNRLQANGYKLRVLTWGSMESTPEFDEATEIAKKEWLAEHLPSVHWDEIVVSPYGVEKSTLGHRWGGILFDDNEQVRNSWKGEAFTEKEIMQVLRHLGR